ncbi:acyltransferase family protein [Hymenobacter perfusus]|uniref:Acyltransferase n=1 Tax=Hymenobacter perfusus TaxID=1236770 RepID=A0A3R9MHD4_9BACT|nr:acyltransferase [Hymenobacter perfusus]RSK42219.1 acyltransferase [Hymenobacter perfusus]
MSAPALLTQSDAFSVPARQTYLPAFTGVRAMAAYLVFLHHFNPFAGNAALVPFSALVREFHIGVPVFFVLSGFLITLRYSTHALTQPSQWLRYMRNRFARIYPVYFLLTLLTYLVFWQRGIFFLRDIVLSLSITQSFFDGSKYAGIAQAWSLTVEECFYLAAPLAFWQLRRRAVLLWWQPFVLLAVGSCLVLACAPHYSRFTGFFGSFRFMLLFTFPGRCFEFYAGMQLAFWYQQGRLRRYRVRGLLTATGLAVMAAVVCGMVIIKGGYTYGREHPLGVALNNVVLPGGILLFFAGLLTENTWVRRLLSTHLLQILGKSSYVFYLIHMGVVHDWLAQSITSNNMVLFLLLNAVAVALHYGLEEPLNRWLRPRPVLSTLS